MATQDTWTGLGLWRASECCTSVQGTLHSYVFVKLNIWIFCLSMPRTPPPHSPKWILIYSVFLFIRLNIWISVLPRNHYNPPPPYSEKWIFAFSDFPCVKVNIWISCFSILRNHNPPPLDYKKWIFAYSISPFIKVNIWIFGFSISRNHYPPPPLITKSEYFHLHFLHS